MKKLFSILFIVSCILSSVLKSQALTFDEAFSRTDKTPMVVLIYANWADGYMNTLQQYKMAQMQLGDKFNFTELDIASPQAKSFNDKFHIYPKLPYILMFRDNGKVSRYISRDCASSASCTVSKLKSFIQ